MKKKVKRMLDWFYQDTDRGEQNISECQNIYELVERLQYRLEDMENEHMQLTRQMSSLHSRLDMLAENLPNEN